MKMPNISACDVTECSYNQNKKCHALAITIGDGNHPHCDTYCHSGSKGGDPGSLGKVGACKILNCKFNQDLECSSQGINVGFGIDEADCLTFQAKK